MIHQLNMAGKDMVDVAIERIKTFEPPEGYYLAFSGGKDSVVCKALCDMAGVKYDAHYRITTVDPPELVQFIKSEHPDVSREHRYWKDDGKYHRAGEPITMWNLIPQKKMPPTRMARYCCDYLKEQGSKDRFVITGVRRAESAARSIRGGLEVTDSNNTRAMKEMLDPDNPDQQLIHICMAKSQRILNPIIDWSTEDVWEFIREYNIPYCKLYDEGFKRLGCIGCPLSGGEQQNREFQRWPSYRKAYKKAFEKMLIEKSESVDMTKSTLWTDAESVMVWWTGKTKKG